MLKCLGRDQETREVIASLKHEYEIGRHLQAPTIIQMHALEYYRNLPVVVLEDFGGESLLNLMQSQRFEIRELLDIAVQIARGLGEIHAANIIHKDINPSNIVYNPNTGVLKIIDFGISSSLTREQAAIANPQVVEASLPYVSPEQTGRMNRSIDYRSDFYSLGVTLYELLTRQLPFSVSEPIEWFHCHIAKQPLPPNQVDPDIPQVLSDIVMKLMAKMAEDRYQSAGGVEADLRHCLEQLKSTGNIERFQLGRDEIPQHFQIPQKLYGREHEVSRLLSIFDRVAGGSIEIALVSGYSGIGKTCLIRELYKPITERRGYFISGKFDQLHRNVPYSAILGALRDMLRQLLTQSERQLALWKHKILAALGPNGQLIIDLLRDLEIIIGPQDPVADLPPVESEQRFNRAFVSFIKVFAEADHPLAIFLDDLQWADSASLNLLQILTHPDTGCAHIMLIGAYRDNEVSPAHPLLLSVRNMSELDVAIEQIHLQPLSRETLTELLGDTLYCNRQEVAELADLVILKTAGNPFFTEEFLKDLNKQQLIQYAPDRHQWQWDIKNIRSQKMTDNVVDLMKDKLRQLQPESLQLMQLAACIGNRFGLRDLATVSEQPHSAISEHLRSAMNEGVIAPIGDAYQLLVLDDSTESEVTVEFAFAHDRIQQAAYSLLEESNRQKTHLKIGRLLQKNLPERQQQQLFDITNHLNLGIEYLNSEQERLQLCRLNLKAGKKAKAANAYQAAFMYLATAKSLLPPQSWNSDYELTLELHSEAAEAAFLSKDYASMDGLLEDGFTNAQNLLDKISLYLVQISALIARGQLAEAVQLAKPVMWKLGRYYRYPKNPGQFHVLIEVLKNLVVLRKPDLSALANAPAMKDPQHIAAHAIGERVGSAVIFIQPEMFAIMAIRSARIQYRFGHCTSALGSWAVYGMVLASQLNKAVQGHAFGQLSIDLSKRFQLRQALTRCMHVFNAMVRHWKEPVQTTIEPLKQTYRMALENGDFEYAVLAWEICLFNQLDAGYDLTQLQQELRESYDGIKPLKQGHNLDYVSILLQACDNLLGQASDPAVLVGAHYDIHQKREQHAQLGDKTLISTDHEISIWLRYLFGDIKGALQQADSTPIENSLVGGFFKTVRVYMIDALIRLANIADASSSEKRRLMRQVKQVQSKIRAWAKSSPENFHHKYLIVEAERMRVSGEHYRAHTLFDEAIQSSANNGFIQEQALASELCGCMHMAAGRITVARPYLIQARDLYARWGALAKVQQLQQRFPQFLIELRQKEAATSRVGTQTERLESIDITALMKALKAIADEKVHSRMLEAIIAASVEFAGAQKGLLILRNADGVFCIEGEYNVDGGAPRVLQSLPIEQGELSQPLVNLVMRTQTSIVINDAQQPQSDISGINKDDYILRHRVRSVLCLPILSGSDEAKELIGVLYLENNLATGTFTQERFDTLEIIAMAAAGRLELSRKAAFDGLTGLFNHEYFQNALNQEFASSRSHNRDMGLLLIDIDHFKQFNDTWGHQVGDLVLREVAQLIKSGCRASDLVARYGGEEMAVILPTTGVPRAEEVAERLRNSVASHRVLHEGNSLSVTISVGIAMLSDAMKDKDELIRKADAALYRSKENGRNQVTIDKP